jgi:GNAT superfamily N-acetyltransferase
MDQLQIRPLTLLEMSVPLGWAKQEGWNPGLQDKGPFWQADPAGFIGGFLGDQLIATVAAVRYEPAFGFIGFYLVDPAHRGRGYGIQVWEAGLAHLEGLPSIGLDGVVAQQDNYQKSGFAYAHNNARQEGYPQRDGLTITLSAGERLLPSSEVSFEALAGFDAQHFASPRTRFLSAWIKQAGHRSRVILRGHQVCGYGVIRPCALGYKIGPLFAQTAAQARNLILALCQNLSPDAPIYIDTPTQNLAAIELAREFGMRTVFETARMYKGSMPDLPLDEIFGITTFELG